MRSLSNSGLNPLEELTLLGLMPTWLNSYKTGARNGTRTRKAEASVWKTETLPLRAIPARNLEERERFELSGAFTPLP